MVVIVVNSIWNVKDLCDRTNEPYRFPSPDNAPTASYCLRSGRELDEKISHSYVYIYICTAMHAYCSVHVEAGFETV